jgi:ribosome biogenesis GTPase / thiamine phosphate phosphatase
MQLEKFGWTGFFANQQCNGVPGRVASANRERFLVWTEAGDVDAQPGGSLRASGRLWPAVGDWVALRPGTTVIDRVLERKTLLARKQPGRALEEQVMAANIDVLFIVTGLDGDYNQRRIERYLVLAHQSGARPVVVLNKAELAQSRGIDLPATVSRLQCASGALVLPVCALTGDGLSAFAPLLAEGETAALIGSSGAGKSTIVNRLLGEEVQPTRAVRDHDHRGRHTTTGRSLFLLPGGWLLIDMPGLREIQLWGAPQPLDDGFADIQETAAACRFRDCTHTREPGCAVLASPIEPGRLENYRKMQRELEYIERQSDKRLESENKARWKVIHKAMRHASRFNPET